MSAAGEACDVEFSFAQEQDFQQVLNICSGDAFDGLDYMAANFHRWLQEPGRLVFIATMKDRVVALESALLVDGGQTAVFQGLRVTPDMRGLGVAGALQKHVTDYIRRHYPRVSAVRLSRGDQPPPQTLAKYRLIAKEAILSLCCEAADLGTFVAELGNRLPCQADSCSHGPVILNKHQVEALILTDHVVSNLLPSKTIINDWEPLKPMEANLDVLRRRGLTWIVDQESEPSAVSLCTTPYPVPYRQDALHFNVNIFGRSLASVCAVFVAQLEALLPTLHGYLIFHTYVHPEFDLPTSLILIETTVSQTVLIQGLRVVPDLRGHGIGGNLQKYTNDYIRCHYQQMARWTRGDQPSPQVLAKYRLTAKEVINLCTKDDYNGLDYMAATFHCWLQEPGRLVFIAKMKDRVVALESTLLVDGGQTVLLQGLRVLPELRGRGIGAALQKYVADYIRQHYPEVCTVMQTRGVQPSPQVLAQYRVIAKEAILSLCCEEKDVSLFLAELQSRLPLQTHSSACRPVTLNQQQVETLILTDHVVSNLLPGKTIMYTWEPLKPMEANLEVLRRRRLTWIADHEFEPTAISLRSPPYAVPYRPDALLININIFGRSLASVCAVFVAQLEALLPTLRG